MTIGDERGGGADGSQEQTVYLEKARGLVRGIGFSMTDLLGGKEDAQRILAYAESLAKESRKGLTVEFNQKHKGIPFKTTMQVLRDSLLAWFARRDKNVRVTFETSNSTRLGEVRAVFTGEAKKVRFKIHVDAMFTMAGGSSEESPCYLKELNVSINRQ